MVVARWSIDCQLKMLFSNHIFPFDLLEFAIKRAIKRLFYCSHFYKFFLIYLFAINRSPYKKCCFSARQDAPNRILASHSRLKRISLIYEESVHSGEGGDTLLGDSLHTNIHQHHHHLDLSRPFNRPLCGLLSFTLVSVADFQVLAAS